jgi:hypothetical protein
MNVPHNLIAEFSADHPVTGVRGFMDYNEGDNYDGIGRKVQELIMKTNTFIVFIDEYGGVQWGFSSVPCSAEHYDIVCNRVAELETRSRFLRVRSGPKNGEDVATHQHALFSARRLIAEAIARLLSSGSVESAQGMLGTAEKWIAQRSLEYSRGWLLVPFGGLAAAGLLRSSTRSGWPARKRVTGVVGVGGAARWGRCLDFQCELQPQNPLRRDGRPQSPFAGSRIALAGWNFRWTCRAIAGAGKCVVWLPGECG